MTSKCSLTNNSSYVSVEIVYALRTSAMDTVKDGGKSVRDKKNVHI